jgi:hypothetical protein
VFFCGYAFTLCWSGFILLGECGSSSYNECGSGSNKTLTNSPRRRTTTSFNKC